MANIVQTASVIPSTKHSAIKQTGLFFVPTLEFETNLLAMSLSIIQYRRNFIDNCFQNAFIIKKQLLLSLPLPFLKM